ncbi:proline dipeptidase pepQ [Metamycoplasma arthritidis]|uniref:Impact N-terminal domain-containing protein n=1 Tax=Metamycoplasma arthritidis (strain 158L3-1) TaxID=243272 RepID=B3PMT3_META1|nr:YigZ family protein [Metamycoplasma arthritidis]ACF07335.1 conserved hypothetical protein [Metamycoplasma arthritidis 158L3-1]VEU78858.1 proline dipeptidase pepQ [Metamycoplasma arthritidis]
MPIYEEKKSKFISYIFDVNDKNDIKELKLKLAKEHKKAKHIVHAYVCESNGIRSGGYSDDGEPQGVAGKPLYSLLETKYLINKAIFVVRYFGGIELGKSNLLRAYLKAALLIFES